jgi:hypothetical protein
MAVGRYYIMEFKNVEEKIVKVLIGDNSIEADVPEYISLDPSGDPLRISTIDNEEDKFSPIKSQRAVISFHSNDQTNLNTFADGPDDRFSVSILYETHICFEGFLSLADNQEAFLPARNEVVLTANDKLNALQDIPLTDDDGNNPEGKYTLAEIAVMCLKKTGLTYPLRVMHNLRHGTGQRAIAATFADLSEDYFITMDIADTDFFYPGQRVQVTGTTSNNVTFTVLGIGAVLIGIVSGDMDFTPETVTATFTDISSDAHFYEHYLDIKTFEDEIGVSENCYDVLTKILGKDCFLIQHREAWWICRVDEYEGFPFYFAIFNPDGSFNQIYQENGLIKTLGKDSTHWFEGEATIVLSSRPIKLAKLTFNFEYPAEIICNQSYERGDFIEDLPSETNSDGIEEDVKKYDLECWDSLSKEGGGAPNTLAYYDQAQIAGADLYVKKYYYRDEERNRELVIKAAPGTGAGVPYMKSRAIEVSANDLIAFSIDVTYSNIGGSSGYINTPVLVQLIADDGTIYFWQAYDVMNPEAKQEWVVVTTGVVPNWYLGAAIDEGTTQMSYESPPAPKSGKLYIYLINQYGEEVTAHYTQPDITITPLLNGSYKQYKGRYHKVERAADGYLAKVEDDVYISDTFGKSLKGTLFFLADSEYQLTQLWYNASRVALGNPDSTTLFKPFGWHQVYGVWNQYRLANRISHVQVQGFGEELPNLLHKYLISDNSPHSVNREFLMVTCEKDLFLCNMTGTVEQVYHTTEGKSYEDPHEFKYIS